MRSALAIRRPSRSPAHVKDLESQVVLPQHQVDDAIHTVHRPFHIPLIRDWTAPDSHKYRFRRPRRPRSHWSIGGARVGWAGVFRMFNRTGRRFAAAAHG